VVSQVSLIFFGLIKVVRNRWCKILQVIFPMIQFFRELQDFFYYI
jgi:hypothetical protein